jgi:ribosomal protein S18 acetylase RimI-like enzyme
MASLTIDFARSDEDVDAVKDIFLEYLEFIEKELGESLCFQDTEREFKDLRAMYDDLFLARVDGQAVAACGFKRFSDTECELKRLYCRPAGRGHSLGRKLTEICIKEGRRRGYTRMLLDTNRDLIAANAIYEKLGFTDIEKYYDNPLGCSRYMALDL